MQEYHQIKKMKEDRKFLSSRSMDHRRSTQEEDEGVRNVRYHARRIKTTTVYAAKRVRKDR